MFFLTQWRWKWRVYDVVTDLRHSNISPFLISHFIILEWATSEECWAHILFALNVCEIVFYCFERWARDKRARVDELLPTSAAICIKHQSKYYIILINMWNMSDFFLLQRFMFQILSHLHICERPTKKDFCEIYFLLNCWSFVSKQRTNAFRVTKIFRFPFEAYKMGKWKKETFELSNIFVV